MPRTPSDAAPDLRQYLDKLPTIAVIRDRLRQHRDEGKLLRRLLKLAVDTEAVATQEGTSHE